MWQYDKEIRRVYLTLPEILISEAVVQRCSIKKVFLKISQNSEENSFARVCFLIRFAGQACNFIKKETLA